MGSEKGIGSKFDKILLRYGEIFLKGKNQNVFERKLINNIKKIIGSHNLNKLRSRYILDFFENHNENTIFYSTFLSCYFWWWRIHFLSLGKRTSKKWT